MLKPSEKMLAQLTNDEQIDYSIDSISLDFATSQSQYSDPDLEQLFTEDRARPYIFIKLINLLFFVLFYKKEQKTNLKLLAK